MENKRLDKNGHEVLDPNPMEIPAGFRRPYTMKELVQRVVRTVVSDQAREQGQESFEDADDFVTDNEDDDELRSPYQLSDEQENAKFIEEQPKEVKKSLPEKKGKEAKKVKDKKPQRGTNDTTNEDDVAEGTDDQSEEE